MSAYVLSQVSEDRLKKVHPLLVLVIRRALEIDKANNGPDFGVIQGARTDEECFENFGKGRSVYECLKGGCPAKFSQPGIPKVTWLNHALSSNHRIQKDGWGHAVDLFPGTWDVVTGGPYDKVAKSMFQAFDELKKAGKIPASAKLRWGADWNQNGKPREKGETDNPHFELIL